MINTIPAELYPDLAKIIDRHYTDGVDRILAAEVADDDSIICVAQDGSKQLAIQITDTDIKIKLYNPTAKFNQEPDTSEQIATNLQKIGDPIVGGWLRQIEQMLVTSDDLESARESLFQLYPDLDGTELTQQMTDAIAAASMAGFWESSPPGDAEFAKIPEGTVRRRSGVDYTLIGSRWHRSSGQSDRKLRPAEHIRRAEIDDLVSKLEEDLKQVDDRINASKDINEIIELQRRETTDAIGDKFIRDLMDLNPREDAEEWASEIDVWESGDKTVREKTLTNAADFYQLIGKDLGIKKVDGGGYGSRACATMATNSVSIPKLYKQSGRRRAQFHEMAHFTEFRDLESCQIAKDWIKSRSNRPPQPLSKICNNPGYDAEEIAYEDNFMHPYIGKVYAANVTEVHSMGLESFSNGHTLVKLFKQDREHFDLMTRYIAI